jgi:hypothetical protein
MPLKRVVYLFGAGATISEAIQAGIEQHLSLRDVSEIVLEKAKTDQNLEGILGTIPSDAIRDIEIYISLLESIRTERYSEVASKLRTLFCETIEENLLQEGQPIEPKLAMALLQFHKNAEVQNIEQLKGIITVNYDNLLDRAFNEVYGGINYGIKCICMSGNYRLNDKYPPLIKLHGAFNWRRGLPHTLIHESQQERKEMLWIPPGIAKARERYPFNLLWGKAFELLDCDLLRIVGCSLSQNDWGLISLLFKTQSRSDENYKIEIIKSHEGGIDLRKRNGFLSNVKVLGELDGCQDFVDFKPDNVFESWLKRTFSIFEERGIKVKNAGLNYIDNLFGVEEE